MFLLFCFIFLFFERKSLQYSFLGRLYFETGTETPFQLHNPLKVAIIVLLFLFLSYVNMKIDTLSFICKILFYVKI